MTSKELMARLVAGRGAFDARVTAVPPERFDTAPEGFAHSPKEIVAHITAYEGLIVQRLRAARIGETTSFDRDRTGWEAFNDRVWVEARSAAADEVLERSHSVFGELLDEVAELTDADLNGQEGIAAALDPAWLDGSTLAELIAIDAYDHYPMHFEALEAAAAE